MRDRLKDKKYFKRYLTETDRLIKKRIKKFRQGLIKPEREQIVKIDMIPQYLEGVVATYSYGGELGAMREYFGPVIDLVDQYWHESEKLTYNRKTLDQYGLSSYYEMLRILSLGYLLDIPNEEFEKLSRAIERDNVKDWIYSFLISSKLDNRKMSTEESYSYIYGVPEFYRSLREAILEEDEAHSAELVQKFVETEWYENFKKEGGGRVEIHNHPEDIYYGYWCFEAAAVVKIKGLDDSSFRDHPYYPADLVHGMEKPPKKKKGFFGW